jgi:hypothetical protein
MTGREDHGKEMQSVGFLQEQAIGWPASPTGSVLGLGI